jgi:hypothetical protein
MGTQICVCKDLNLDNWVYSTLYSLHTDTVLLSSCGRPRKFTATTSLIRFVRLSFYVLCASRMRNHFFSQANETDVGGSCFLHYLSTNQSMPSMFRLTNICFWHLLPPRLICPSANTRNAHVDFMLHFSSLCISWQA